MLLAIILYNYSWSFLFQVKTIVFDKTGTLTHGKPIVTKVLLFVSETVCPNHLFAAIMGVAERSSEHPLGVAVVNFAKQVTFHISLCIVKYVNLTYNLVVVYTHDFLRLWVVN